MSYRKLEIRGPDFKFDIFIHAYQSIHWLFKLKMLLKYLLQAVNQNFERYNNYF